VANKQTDGDRSSHTSAQNGAATWRTEHAVQALYLLMLSDP